MGNLGDISIECDENWNAPKDMMIRKNGINFGTFQPQVLYMSVYNTRVTQRVVKPEFFGKQLVARAGIFVNELLNILSTGAVVIFNGLLIILSTLWVSDPVMIAIMGHLSRNQTLV